MGEIHIEEQNNNDLEDFFNLTRADIENKILDTIRDKQIVEILNGGKRLRSLLAALAFPALKISSSHWDLGDIFPKKVQIKSNIHLFLIL